MAFTSGTATTWLTLLETLTTFATTNGWTLRKTVGSGTETLQERYLEGPGSVTGVPVNVNIRTFADSPNAVFNWEIRGAISFNTNLAFELQEGSSNAVFLRMRETNLGYWLSVSSRRIMMTIRSGTTYYSFYAGFFLPFATPSEYPLPYYVAATSPVTGIFTESNARFRAISDPGEQGAYVREPGGSWQLVYNHESNFGLEDDYVSHANEYYTWPYYEGWGTTTDANDLIGLDLRPPETDSNSVLILPVHIVGGTNNNLGNLGILEEVYWLSGFGQGAEDTFAISDSRAQGVLTLSGQPLNNETVTIGTKTYTFQTTLTDTDGNVAIGATAAESLQNLQAAISLGLGSGTRYAASTTLLGSAFVGPRTATTLTVIARIPGASTVATTETLTNGAWGAATLQGGAAAETYRVFQNGTRNDANHFYAIKQV